MNDTSQLRLYLALLRRNWWLIAQSALVVGAIAYWMTTRAPDEPFRSAAVVQIEQVDQSNSSGFDDFGYLDAQERVLLSRPVLQAASELVPGETTDSIAGAVSSSVDEVVSTISVEASAEDPRRPPLIANAVADAFVENRRSARTASLQERADQLQAQLDTLETQIADLGAQLFTATAEGRDGAVFEAGRDAALSQYQSLFTSQQDLLNEITLARVPATLIEPAEGSFQAASPDPVRRGLAAAVVGLALGIGLSIVRELLDDRLRTRPDIERLTGSRIFGELPEARIRWKRSELPVIDTPDRSIAEAFRGLRTSLQFQSVGRQIESIAVISAEPGDGKTTVAANLAASFASAGVPTLLISADLRSPALDVLFGVSGSRGLSDLLTASIARGDGLSIDDAIVQTRVPNLSILPAGSSVANPAEMLSHPNAQKLFVELRTAAEVVIADCPPTLVADSALLASLVDGTVLVTSLGRTHRRRITQAVAVLGETGTPVLGVVVNRVRKADGGEYGYGGYGRYESRSLKRPRRARRRARAKATTVTIPLEVGE
jgi:capsular exopolysaccharide synthesis family protein